MIGFIFAVMIISLVAVVAGYIKDEKTGDNIMKHILNMFKYGFLIFMINFWVIIAAIAIIIFAILH